MSTRLSPSSAPLPPTAKARETARLARSYVERFREPLDLSPIRFDLDEYDELLREHAGRPLVSCRVFEIGFGARPYRLAALQGAGVDAFGIDAEVPVWRGSPREVAAAWRTNGAERAIKSAVRRAVFDPRERAALRRALAPAGIVPRLDPSTLHVGDAADAGLPTGSVDLVLSEEVLQSVRRPSLERLVPEMARWLAPGGLALVRPCVFTGITGGLLQEWSRWAVAHPPRRRRSEPWEHLRQDRFAPNTHANRLTRADFRELFGAHFDILEERVRFPGLGREHLTGETARALDGWPDEELFSNCVLFVLAPKGRG
jgi:SAM-dependent methyltransferase